MYLMNTLSLSTFLINLILQVSYPVNPDNPVNPGSDKKRFTKIERI